MARSDDRDESSGLAFIAGMLADGTRATFCSALMDGRAWTPTELARRANVAPSTATEHLNLLVTAGLLVEHRQGRHRYLRLAGPEVAALIESLSAAAPLRPPVPRSLSTASRQRALAAARTCYDHLAGALGVAIADAMTERGWLSWDRGLALTGAGGRWLATLGISDQPVPGGRPLLRSCLDWTERRPHLAGRVGAALCAHALETGWVVRVGTGRAVAVTPAGHRALTAELGLDLDRPQSTPTDRHGSAA